jgi:hypothetical protein
VRIDARAENIPTTCCRVLRLLNAYRERRHLEAIGCEIAKSLPAFRASQKRYLLAKGLCHMLNRLSKSQSGIFDPYDASRNTYENIIVAATASSLSIFASAVVFNEVSLANG